MPQVFIPVANRGRLQAGRCFSQEPLAVGSSFTGCAFGGGPGAQWTRPYSCYGIHDYRERRAQFATAYKTIENVVLSLLFADRRRKTLRLCITSYIYSAWITSIEPRLGKDRRLRARRQSHRYRRSRQQCEGFATKFEIRFVFLAVEII